MDEETQELCTCTLACIPAGLTEDQVCRLSEVADVAELVEDERRDYDVIVL